MADGTKIEWTDATANVINGCSLASPGCTNCYAMRLAGTRMKKHPTRAGLTQDTKTGPVWTGEVRFHEPALQHVLRWEAPRRIFWNAHGDLFHPNVPDAWIDRCFAAMALTPQHKHQVLTKRSARMREYLTGMGMVNRKMAIWQAMYGEVKTRDAGAQLDSWYGGPSAAQWPLPNVWLGVSVEDQARADERIPDLLATPAAVRWISAEPLLGPVDLTRIDPPHAVGVSENVLTGQWVDFSQPTPNGPDSGTCTKLDWVVAGGESGPGARPMHPAWASSLRDQCAAAGVPFLFKQWGEWAPVCDIPDTDEMDAKLYMKPRTVEGRRRCKVEQCTLQASGRRFDMDCRSRTFGEDPANGDFAYLAGTGAMQMFAIGKKAAGRLLAGVQHDGYPQVPA